MGTAFTPGLQVLEAKTVTKLRELPVEGEVLVSVGDVVNAEDVVAQAQLPGDLVILRLPEKMGLQSFEVLEGLRIQEGQVVQAGELMCEYAGLFGLIKSRYITPIDGTVEFINKKNAHIGLRKPSSPIDLKAFISGKVVAIEARRSVKIEVSAAFIQGIFGVGGERTGVIKLLDVDHDKKITQNDIPENCEGLVLVGGTCPDYAALQAAAERGARGFVTGAVDDIALRQYLGFDLGIALTGDEEISMTLIATEGFGSIALSSRVYDLCAEHKGQACSINGATQVRAGALRPEIIISHSREAHEATQSVSKGLVEGASVRIIRVPHFGKQGIVRSLPIEPEVIDSGAKTRVVEVELDSGDVTKVPRANVELL